jgi:uncharacterized protein (UPF0332 family)
VDPFDDCVAKGRLKKVEPDAEKIAAELDTAREELARAVSCYTGGNWGEAAMQAYFALYRSARAAIYSQGYRDTNLYGLCAAVRRLFVETEKAPERIIDQIRDAKDIKDLVYDGGRAARRDARQVLGWAQAFVKLVFALLALPGFDADSISTSIPEGGNRGNALEGPRRPGGDQDPFRPRHNR